MVMVERPLPNPLASTPDSNCGATAASVKCRMIDMGHSHIGPSRSRPGSRDLVILMLYREDKAHAKDLSWLHHHDLVASLVTLTFKLSARLSARCALISISKRLKGPEVVEPSLW